MEILKTENLTKVYKQGDDEIYASKDVNISIDKGEMIAIVGKSGSGKTTLLNLLGAIDRPTSGKVILNNIDMFSLNDDNLADVRRTKIGYIFQNYNLIPIMTAEENIIMPILLDSKKVDKEYLDELANILGIDNRLKHLPSELSGGQQQRVAIARALINRPDIILADEPTGNLDKKSADELLLLFQEINKFGNTIIMVTHDEKYASMCNR